MDNNGTTKTTNTFTEAPASWNCRYITATGFECQLTLRDASGLELLKKAESAIKVIIDQGNLPTAGKSANGNGAATNPAAFCTIHQVAMKKHEKDGQIWYSHKDGDSFCRGASKS
jgi:hypothetical protein